MKVKCIGNKYEELKDYEYKTLSKGEFGRFYISNEGKYPISIGKEYLVMGIVMFQNNLSYLIDDSSFILTVPCYLFETTDSKLTSGWYFRVIEKEESIYPFIQAIWGYKELCLDKQSYENLIVEQEEETQQIYFHRKMELLQMDMDEDL